MILLVLKVKRDSSSSKKNKDKLSIEVIDKWGKRQTLKEKNVQIYNQNFYQNGKTNKQSKDGQKICNIVQLQMFYKWRRHDI